MGAWGVGIFDNDSASDMIFELEEENDLSIIILKLLAPSSRFNENTEELIDSDIASETLAAAEIVAALLNKPNTELPTSINKWLAKKKVPDKDIISAMNKIVKALNLGKEFKEAWKSYTNEHKWQFALKYLATISIQSIDLVIKNSELKDLWEESCDYNKWLETIEDLRYRLTI